MMTRANEAGIRFWGLGQAAMGATVLWAALMGGVPMPEEAHGDAIHTIPAEAWALAVITTGLLMAWASCGPRLLALATGALFAGAMNMVLALFASDATYGFLVARGAGLISVTNIAIVVACAFDAVGLWNENRLREEIERRHDDLRL